MAAAGDDKGTDFYEVLGLKKECTSSELRNAYKKLAMRWHPDRCSASGNPKFVEEAKKKFQAIQQAYSVLSDDNKRFLYDVGVYDNDDDENGMGEFLNEMADMMSQTKPSENGEESFEQLKQLFNDMFNGDDAFGSTSATFSSPQSSSSSFASCCESSGSNNKRTSVEMNLGTSMSSDFDPQFQSFCFGAARRPQSQMIGSGVTGGIQGGRGGRCKNSGKKIYPPMSNYHYELNNTDWKRRKKGRTFSDGIPLSVYKRMHISGSYDPGTSSCLI